MSWWQRFKTWSFSNGSSGFNFESEFNILIPLSDSKNIIGIKDRQECDWKRLRNSEFHEKTKGMSFSNLAFYYFALYTMTRITQV